MPSSNIPAHLAAKAKKYLENPHFYDDKSTVTAFQAGMERVAKGIKDAKGRGIKPGISSEAGRMVPPPPGYDQFAGKVCSGPGVKRNGFGAAKICGRQATAALQALDPENFTLDAPRYPSPQLTNDALAYMAYGASAGPNPVVAASGPRKGRMVADPGTVGPNSRFVCHFHSQGLYKDALHPEDNGGIVPEAPKVTGGDPVFGLDKLTPGRPFRAVSQDANFVWASDGKVTVMCHRADYVRLLASYDLLPDDSTQPLP
jgi:hypothetical protein